MRVPNLYADYLWPFAGSAHPKNRGAFALPGGPYPAEHGDRFLDKLVAEGVPEPRRSERYLAIDIVTEGELDSRLADRTEIQRRLDNLGGYDLAGFIADKFRTEKLFNTRQRITLPLLKRRGGPVVRQARRARLAGRPPAARALPGRRAASSSRRYRPFRPRLGRPGHALSGERGRVFHLRGILRPLYAVRVE